MASKSQLKKQAQAAAAAAGRMEDEVPQMPTMPDPRVKYLWSGDPAVKEFDFTKFIQVWPCYFDSACTLEQGRRVGKEFCCEGPTTHEISEVCQSLNLRHVVEPYKLYPRLFGRSGRIRVEVTGPDGQPKNPDIRNKTDLLKYLGSRIPDLNSRIARLAKQAEEEAAAKKQEEQRQLQLQQSASSGGGSNKKKKGKKK